MIKEEKKPFEALRCMQHRMKRAKTYDEIGDIIVEVFEVKDEISMGVVNPHPILDEKMRVMEYGLKIGDSLYKKICFYCMKYTELKGRSSWTSSKHVCIDCYHNIIVPERDERNKRIEKENGENNG